MISITIGRRKYKGVYRWDDITLERFCRLAAIPMPDGYESYIIADGKFSTETLDEYVQEVSKITDKQLTEDFPLYYRQVIECLTDIPYRKIMLLDRDRVNDMYEYYFKPFVTSLVYHAPVIHFMGEVRAYEPEVFKSFRIGLETFRLPESVKVMDQVVTMAVEPIISYTEASDIFRGMKVSRNDVRRLGLFMAIYCRKKGEVYNEDRVTERQELMMRCRMSVVWSVFFYTVRRLPGSLVITQLFGRLPKSIREVRDQARIYQGMVAAD